MFFAACATIAPQLQPSELSRVLEQDQGWRKVNLGLTNVLLSMCSATKDLSSGQMANAVCINSNCLVYILAKTGVHTKDICRMFPSAAIANYTLLPMCPGKVIVSN